jgi:hypothetical protein
MPADKKRPSGREFRAGTLGDALDDVYAEIAKIAPGTALAALADNTVGAAADDTVSAIGVGPVGDGETCALAADVRNNFAELTAKINEIRAILLAAGISS